MDPIYTLDDGTDVVLSLVTSVSPIEPYWPSGQSVYFVLSGGGRVERSGSEEELERERAQLLNTIRAYNEA